MDRLSVAVPWNLSCYIAANGFHPLYRALFEGDARVAFNTIDEVALARRLRASGRLYRALLLRRKQCLADLPEVLRRSALGTRFVEHLSPSNLALAAELPGALELHHTRPLTAGTRPFVLHCESFLPIFHPFWSQGMGRLHRVAEVRELYSGLFRGESCLGIFSHMPATLDQIRLFFCDPIIDSKLHSSRIGLSQGDLDTLMSDHRAAPVRSPVFLFTTSAEQGSRAFELGGGFAALLFAERFLKSGWAGEFLFRAKRPSNEELHRAGVDVAFIDSIEGVKLLWLESFLPEHEQLRLFAIADFLLAPSVYLHSVPIMRALASGAIPVVSDTYGTETYVADGETGIVLRGVRQAAWREDPESGIPVDQCEFPAMMHERLAEQAFARITDLLATPASLEAFRKRMRMSVERNYFGSQFRDEMIDSLLRIARESRGSLADQTGVRRRPLLAEEKVLHTNGWDRLFESPPQPTLMLNTGIARVFFCKGLYLYMGGSASFSFDELSPLVLREKGHLVPWNVDLGRGILDFPHAVFCLYGNRGLLAAKWRYARFRLHQRVKALLWPHKRVYRLARWVYRTAAAARRRLARPSI